MGLSAAVLFTGYTILCLVPLLLAVIQGNPLRDFTRELSGGLIMVAYVMMLALYHDDLGYLSDVPFFNLALVVVGVPLAAAVAGWLIAGREPPAIARAVIE